MPTRTKEAGFLGYILYQQIGSSSVNKRKRKKQRRPHSAEPDRLISQLKDVEQALQAWIRSSADNAELFRCDPITAMRAAGLDIDDETLLELEQITTAIARKLK